MFDYFKDKFDDFRDNYTLRRNLAFVGIGFGTGMIVTGIQFRKYVKLPEGSAVFTPIVLKELIETNTTTVFDDGTHAFVLAPLKNFDPEKLSEYGKG